MSICFGRKFVVRFVLLAVFLLSLERLVRAAEAPVSVEVRPSQLEAKVNATSAINSGDNAWLLVSSALVLMMTAPGWI